MTVTRCALIAVMIGVAATCQAQDAPRELKREVNALLSASQTKGDDDNSTTLTWHLDGTLERPAGGRLMQFGLVSDYATSESSEVDRLQSSVRLLTPDYGEVKRRWYPVYLLQTEGDHGLEQVRTLLGAGYRQERRYGFVEATLGASKDIQSGESWKGNLGVQASYRRKLGDRWTLATGPKGEVDALGAVGISGDRFRYSWDLSLDYAVNDRLGIGYRAWVGNTVPGSDLTQWVGISYHAR